MGRDLNQEFWVKLASAGTNPEMKKSAEYALTSYVREKIRENGILRSQTLPALNITASQLDKDEDPKILKKFIEVEPDSKATWLPFRGVPESKFVETRFVPVYFGKIESENHVANIYELMNYSNDIRKILNDQDVKNIQTEEDRNFITQLNVIAAANIAEQDLTFSGGLTKINWAMAQQAFFPQKPLAKALMNIRTAKEFLKWDYVSDYGFGPQAAQMVQTGKIPNVNLPIIQTNKTDIIPDGVVYFFTEPDFMGKLLILQEPTTFIEQKKDWISFSTYEVIGAGIINTKSFIKCTFTP